MNTENTSVLNNTNAPRNNAVNNIGSKYARLRGYLEGYLDQMSASKDSQEELISKLLSELGDLLNPAVKNSHEEKPQFN